MSNTVIHNDSAFEPDEDVLISALRNQDDIPILMDVVAEQVAACVSQEEHLAQTFDSLENKEEEQSSNADALNVSQACIAKAITCVLEKRLPELVSEVMQTLSEADKTTLKD